MRKDFMKGMSMMLTMVMVFTMVLGAGMFVSTEDSYAISTTTLHISDKEFDIDDAPAATTTYYYKDLGSITSAAVLPAATDEAWYVAVDTNDSVVTLHLNGFTFSNGIYLNVPSYDVVVELTGTNKINNLITRGDIGYGLYSEQKMAISGAGTLTVTGTSDAYDSDYVIGSGDNLNIDATGEIAIDVTSIADTMYSELRCFTGKNVYIENASFNVSGSAMVYAYGIYTANDLSVSESDLDINLNSGCIAQGVLSNAPVTTPGYIYVDNNSEVVMNLISVNESEGFYAHYCNMYILGDCDLNLYATDSVDSRTSGFYTYRTGDVLLGGNVSIETGGNWIWGVCICNTGNLTTSAFNISASALGSATGLYAPNVYVGGATTMNINAAEEAEGIMAGDNITIDTENNTDSIVINLASEGPTDSTPYYGISCEGNLDILNCDDFTVNATLSGIGSAFYAIDTVGDVNVSNIGSFNIAAFGSDVGYIKGINTSDGGVNINCPCDIDIYSKDTYACINTNSLTLAGITSLRGEANATTEFAEAIRCRGDIDIQANCTIDVLSNKNAYGILIDDASLNIDEVLNITASAGAMAVSIMDEKNLTIGGIGTFNTNIQGTGYGIVCGANLNILGPSHFNLSSSYAGIWTLGGDMNIGNDTAMTINASIGGIIVQASDLNISSGAIDVRTNAGNAINVLAGNFNMTGGTFKAESKTATALAGAGVDLAIEKINISGDAILIGDTIATAKTSVATTDPAITTAKAIVIGEAAPPEPKPSGGGGKATPSYNITENGNTPETTGTTATDKQPSSNNGGTNTVNKGDVKISTKNATAGQKVTVTVNEGIGFVLDDLTIKTTDGKEVKAVDNGDGTYTFEMPAGAVDIEPTFAPDPKVLEKYQDLNPEEYYYQPVAWADKKGITNGVDGKNFGIDSECTRAQMVTFLWRMAGCPVVNNASGFTDVVADSYYEQAVAWATSMGYVKGYSATQFAPNQIVNRCQTVAIMARMAGVADNATGYTHGFTDVNANAYYNNAVAWASQNGITSGRSATQFAPNDDCFRQELITFLFRFDN